MSTRGARAEPRRSRAARRRRRRRPGRDRARHPRRRGRVRGLGRRAHADRRGRPLAALRRLERRGRAAARARARAGGRGAVRRRVRAATPASRPTTCATEPRWPDLRAALRDQPIRAVLGLPTRLGTPVGTLNLYCERPRVWDESEIAALEAYNSLLEARLAECAAGPAARPDRRSAAVRARQPRHDRAGDRAADGARRRRRRRGLQRAAAGGAQLAPARAAPSPRRCSPSTRATRRAYELTLDGLGRVGARRPAASDGSTRPRRSARTCARSPTRGSTSANASSRPSMKARIGNDSDQRVSALSGRTSCTRSLSQTGVPARCAQIASASSVHGRKAPTSSGQVEAHARPADAAELVEDAGDEAGGGDQRRALPEAAALGRAGVGHEQQQRRGAGEAHEGGECADHDDSSGGLERHAGGAAARPARRTGSGPGRGSVGGPGSGGSGSGSVRMRRGGSGVVAMRAFRGRSRTCPSAGVKPRRSSVRPAERPAPSGAAQLRLAPPARRRRLIVDCQRRATARASAARSLRRPCRWTPSTAGSSRMTGHPNLVASGILGGDDPHHPRRVDVLHLRR